jgi:hypothetical protein
MTINHCIQGFSRLWPPGVATKVRKKRIKEKRHRLALPTLPSPIPSESLALTGDFRLGLDEEQRGAPVRPETREPNPQPSGGRVQTRSATLRPLQNNQLVAEGKVFQLQPCSSSKPRSDADQCEKEWSRHGRTRLTMSPEKINDFKMNEIIGRDRRERLRVGTFSQHAMETLTPLLFSLYWAGTEAVMLGAELLHPALSKPSWVRSGNQCPCKESQRNIDEHRSQGLAAECDPKYYGELPPSPSELLH